MPLGPCLLAAEDPSALFAAFAEVQPLSCIHTASPFFGLSIHTCIHQKPVAQTRTCARMKQHEEGQNSSLMRKDRVSQVQGVSEIEWGHAEEGKMKYKQPLVCGASLLKYHPSCFKNSEF